MPRSLQALDLPAVSSLSRSPPALALPAVSSLSTEESSRSPTYLLSWSRNLLSSPLCLELIGDVNGRTFKTGMISLPSVSPFYTLLSSHKVATFSSLSQLLSSLSQLFSSLSQLNLLNKSALLAHQMSYSRSLNELRHKSRHESRHESRHLLRNRARKLS